MTWRRLFVSLGVAAAMLAAPIAAGQEVGDAPVLLILDASGSMNATDDNGVRLIDGAQEALTRLVEVLPEGAPVGLRVYGHRVPNTDKANGCLDTELIVPVGPLEKDTMVEAIGSFSARGFTPIGLSLEQAASDLPDGRGTIILVSDGEDTCAPPDPCDVAAGLAAEGIDVRVHTVGFFLGEDSPAREQLQCIAETTGASYRDVDAIDSLTGELGQIVQQSGIGNFHVPVQGALARVEAPVLELTAPPGNEASGSRQGFYSNTMFPGQTIWYAVELDAPSSLTISGGLPDAFVADAQPGDRLEAVIVDDTGIQVQLWDSRWGRSSIVLSEIDDPQRTNFGASTGIGFDNLWSVMDPDEQEILAAMGYDEESNDAAVREIVRRPEPPRAGPGTYYLGFAWTASADPEPRGFDFIVSTFPVEPIGDSIHLQYQDVTGSGEAASAAPLAHSEYVRGPIFPGPSDGEQQGGFRSVIGRGSTIWYSVQLEWDEALSVRAFLNRPEGASADDGEVFGVEIYDPEMSLDIRPWGGIEPAMALDDPTALDTSFLPRGLAPRPLVGGAIESLSAERGTTEGLHLIAFTWEGAADGTSAEVEFIVNVHGGIEAVDEPPDAQPPPDSQLPPGEEAAAPDPEGSGTSGPDRGREMLVNIIAGTVAVGIALLVWRRRRRKAAPSGD